MIVIGITGPTGAGKTTVLNVLEEFGAEIVDCDALYHNMLETDESMLGELKIRFGEDVFGADGTLRRKALGDIVFGHPNALADLNAITHRHILRKLDGLIERAEREGRPAIALDAIALIESGLGERCDVTVAVTADDELRLRRIMAREGISEEYARKRLAAQKPSVWFEERCGHALRNDGSRAELEGKARALFSTIIPKEES